MPRAYLLLLLLPEGAFQERVQWRGIKMSPMPKVLAPSVGRRYAEEDGVVSDAREQIQAFIHGYIHSFQNKYERLSSKDLGIWQ